MSYSIAELFEEGGRISLEPGRAVFRSGDPVRFMYLLSDGQIDLVRHTRSGALLTLHRAGPGKILAEASAYSAAYHCEGLVKSSADLRTLPVSTFCDKLRNSPDASQYWARKLARELQSARMQSEIRSLKTVAERLDAWLGDSNELPPKGKFQDLAHIIGVSREALYRELARRRG